MLRLCLWRPARVWGILPASFLLASTSAAQEPQASDRGSTLLADSTIRAEVMRIVIDSTPAQTHVHVDPQPIPDELDSLGNEFIPSADAVRSGPGLNRLGDIERLALRSSNDVIREHCGSRLIPYSPETIHKGCPAESELLVVIGHAWAVNRSRLDSRKRRWSESALAAFFGPSECSRPLCRRRAARRWSRTISLRLIGTGGAWPQELDECISSSAHARSPETLAAHGPTRSTTDL